MSNDANTKIVLPAVLDLAAAESLRDLLLQRIGDRLPLSVDAASVDTLTLPCVQVLLAAGQHRAGIAILNPSMAFISAFADLGLQPDWDDRPESELPTSEPEMVTMAEPEKVVMAEPEQMRIPAEEAPPLAAGESESQSVATSAAGKRILTIDDSKTMRDMLMLTLAEAGFDVLQAVDGQDGLDVLVNERVDVVITDINMPRMDGYEVIRQLRSKPEHKDMPILVLTTESEADKRNIAREAGATGWMVKPFDPDRLIETVRMVAP